MIKLPTIEQLDQFGRPYTRFMMGTVCSIIGLSIAAAFANWGFLGHPIPSVPLGDLAVPALPFLYQAWDNVVRQHGKNVLARVADTVNFAGSRTA